MKKKVLLLSLALMLLLTGIVSAAASWGMFEGYKIIRITVDGKTVKGDTPAINFKGRTMVPIYMLKDAGINYEWDGETNTVAVKGNTVKSDTSKIKTLFLMADYYKQLSDLGDSLADISTSLSLAYNGISKLNNRTALDNVYKYLDGYINNYNDKLEYLNSMTSSLKKYGIATSDANEILNNYYEAIEHYKKAISYLEDYNVDGGSMNSFDGYLDESSAGFDVTYDGLDIVLVKYNEFKKLIISE